MDEDEENRQVWQQVYVDGPLWHKIIMQFRRLCTQGYTIYQNHVWTDMLPNKGEHSSKDIYQRHF